MIELEIRRERRWTPAEAWAVAAGVLAAVVVVEFGVILAMLSVLKGGG